MSKKIIPLLVIMLVVVGVWYAWGSGERSSQVDADIFAAQAAKNADATHAPEAVQEGTLASGTMSSTAPTPITSANNKKIMNATLHTNKGDITVEFFDNDAPNTVANFIKLAGSGFYDGTKFHRVIKDFMIQGGDPLTKDDAMAARWGTGGPGYQFNDELRPNNKNDIGTISMANSGPNTNGSQFFINVAANNFLDGKHTTFGRVKAGMDVVTAIENTATAPGDRPIEPIIIHSISLQ